ncbi:DUF2306 domain-containing protein [Embleya sp. NPDC050493]|uniref:DUF2306 domain-containing protein n=1 Tax=Embleya sp. NPDC050493 TaxID=3363989 RepID=UPI0037AA0421
MTAVTHESTRRRTVGVWWLALSALAVAVFAPLPYLTDTLADLASDDSGIAANYADRPRWAQAFFYTHIVAAGLALLLSPAQLSARVRRRSPRLHRICGRVTVACILLGGAAGLVLAPLNLAGAVGTAGFGMPAVLWVTCALMGLRAIRWGTVGEHRRWMQRAFAFTYAAVTLRLWLVVLVPMTDFDRAYRVVPFLCWVPNLIVVELLLRRRGQRPRAGHRQADPARDPAPDPQPRAG